MSANKLVKLYYGDQQFQQYHSFVSATKQSVSVLTNVMPVLFFLKKHLYLSLSVCVFVCRVYGTSLKKFKLVRTTDLHGKFRYCEINTDAGVFFLINAKRSLEVSRSTVKHHVAFL